jgi:hypothetical protein
MKSTGRAHAYEVAAIMLGACVIVGLGVLCAVGVAACYAMLGLGRFSDAVHRWRTGRGHAP